VETVATPAIQEGVASTEESVSAVSQKTEAVVESVPAEAVENTVAQ